MHHKKNGWLLACSIIFLSPTFAIAKEPANLAIVKQELVRYHDSGEYNQDINTVATEAQRYLESRLAHPIAADKKPAIVLDIDETALSNYPSMIKLGFGGTLEEIRQNENKGVDPVLEPTLKLFRYAEAHQVAIFFLTGRKEYERQATIENLEKAGYNHWNGLILRSKAYEKAPAAEYKTAMRKQLIEQGYDIILSAGDQDSDLAGGYADKTFKLPDPYYLIP
jgi:acid phosphatase